MAALQRRAERIYQSKKEAVIDQAWAASMQANLCEHANIELATQEGRLLARVARIANGASAAEKSVTRYQWLMGLDESDSSAVPRPTGQVVEMPVAMCFDNWSKTGPNCPPEFRQSNQDRQREFQRAGMSPQSAAEAAEAARRTDHNGHPGYVCEGCSASAADKKLLRCQRCQWAWCASRATSHAKWQE